MKKVLYLIAGLLMAVCGLQAQTYSADAILLDQNKVTATVRSSGTDAKKKEATEMAAKSAIHTYLFSGIEGLNDSKPLLGSSPSDKAKAYAMNLLSSGRYAVFCKNVTLDESASKSVGKTFQAVVTMEIYYVSLKRDLVNNNIISDVPLLDEVDSQLYMPSIMVVPYCMQGETFLSVIQRNPDVRMAMAKVREGFISKGVETKDFEQALRNANTAQARQGDMSLDDVIVNNSGADVMVSVDVTKDVKPEGVRMSLILRAVEASNSRSLAEKSETSGRKNTSPEMVCGALANLMVPDFLTQIQQAMARKVEKGSSVTLRFIIDPNCAMNMDSELGDDYLPLADVLIRWVKKNAVNGKYHQMGRSENLLVLDQIYVANKNESGEILDVNDYALEVYRYLRSLNLSVKRSIVGSTIEITIL